VSGPIFQPAHADIAKGESRNVAAIDYQVKRVCHPCNTGWMSVLEQHAQAVLEPMISGQVRDLSASDQEIVARWAVKTAMTFEFTTPARQFSPTDRREISMGQIPEGHSVYLASCLPDRVGGHCSYAPLRVESDLGYTTAYALTLAVDHLVFQVIGSGKVGNFLIETSEHGAVELGAAIQVWPSSVDSVRWPPPRVLDEIQFEHFVQIPLPKAPPHDDASR
jgi:hypothetical protein